VQRVGVAFAFPRSSDMFYLRIFSDVSPKSGDVCYFSFSVKKNRNKQIHRLIYAKMCKH